MIRTTSTRLEIIAPPVRSPSILITAAQVSTRMPNRSTDGPTTQRGLPVRERTHVVPARHQPRPVPADLPSSGTGPSGPGKPCKSLHPRARARHTGFDQASAGRAPIGLRIAASEANPRNGGRGGRPGGQAAPS
ncbi:hypothetical protein JCM9957A_72520 [Kineosporia succinea]